MSDLKTILIATDGSESARDAARFLAAFPLPTGAAVHVASVVSPVPPPVPAFGDAPVLELERIRRAEEEWAETAARETAAILEREGLAVEAEVCAGDPGHQILAAADRVGADLIVVGSRGLTGLEGFLLGSVARNVAKHSRRPVLVAHAPGSPVDRVVLAVDDSERAGHAAEFTARLPLPPHASVTVTHVVRPYDPFPGLVPDDPDGFQREVEQVRSRRWREAHRIADAARDRVAEGGRTAEVVVREGDPTEQILALAEETDADLIIAGARGASLIEGLLVGSVADRLLKASRRSLVIVH